MLLQVTALCKHSTRGGRVFAAVQDFCLDLDKGEFVSLIGRSGSGKTTILNMLAGLLTPDSGQVLVNGIDIFSLGDRQRSVLRNNTMGYVPQGTSLIPSLTVLDNVRLPWHLQAHQGQSLQTARDLLDEFGISHLEKSYPRSLSGGETRRAALARALINSPELIIADEPTNDLDIETAREIADLLLRLNGRGTAMLIVTHDLEISRCGGRALEISASRDSTDRQAAKSA